MTASIFPENLQGNLSTLHKAFSFLVFLFLDFFDFLLCFLFRFLDRLIEGRTPFCYCWNDKINGNKKMASETLFRRKNFFREMCFSWFCPGQTEENQWRMTNRWSDCGCDSCVSWTSSGDNLSLHFVVKEPSFYDCRESEAPKPLETVIFLHGFMSSSLFWTETIFKHFPEHVTRNYRLIAIDLLGFGNSPKPRNCLYTIEEHVEMIEKTLDSALVLNSNSLHIVAHSMGCNVGLALAAKYPNVAKTVTLVAPPYHPSSDGSCFIALNSLAGKKLWPFLAFGSAVMSWHEHIGRCICFIVCRHHQIWEKIFMLVTGKRELHSKIIDMTKHTHHSAWHSMHNVICGGARFTDGYLERLVSSGVRVQVIQGKEDMVVPSECYINMKVKFPVIDVEVVPMADHETVIIGREEEFVQKLVTTWEESSKD